MEVVFLWLQFALSRAQVCSEGTLSWLNASAILLKEHSSHAYRYSTLTGQNLSFSLSANFSQVSPVFRDNGQLASVSLYHFNDKKVMVDLGDGSPWRIIKTSTNQYKLGNVMCRQLGLGPPISPGYISDPSFLFYGSSIEADAFLCSGWESELSECLLQIVNRSILEEKWLFYSTDFMQLNCLPPETEEFSVVLQKEYSFKDFGVPLVFYEGRWGPLCHNKSNTDEFQNNYNVLCKQLGFDRATDFPYPYIVDVVYWRPVPLKVSCTGEEHSIKDCTHSVNFHIQKCDAFTRISCGSYYSNISLDVNAGVRTGTTRSHHTTVGVALPEESTNIGLSVFILCLFIVAGGCLLCCIFACCWKIWRAPTPTQSQAHAHHVNHLTVQAFGATPTSSLQAPVQDRSQYITDVPPQYPIAPPMPAKDPELPTYEEAMENAENLNNVTAL